MIRIRIIALMVLLSSLAVFGAAQSDTTWRFAAANRYVSAHGRRAWTGGSANQGLEIWAGALQIASEVRPEFRREGDVSMFTARRTLADVAGGTHRSLRSFSRAVV